MLKVINYHIEEIREIDNLTERTKNVCMKGSLDNLYKILSYYINHGNFKKVNNCGEKTNEELIDLAERYIAKYDITIEDLRMNEKTIIFEKFKFYCYERYGIGSEEIELFKQQFLDKDFNFFQFVFLMLKKVFNEREYYIFEHNFGYFKGKSKMTLQSIGDNYEITRERVRQISQNIPSKIVDTLAIFFDDIYYIKEHFHYKLDIKKDFIFIDSKTSESINAAEGLNFTPKFYSLIFSVIFQDDYTMFQANEFEYKNYYLVRKSLAKIFNFNNYYEDVFKRCNSRIELTYTINYSEFLRTFMREFNEEIFNAIKPISEKIVKEEFDLKFDSDKNLIFPRNTLIKLPEYIIDILEETGRPMHLNEISEELKRRTPKAPQNIESLRSSILSVDEIIAIGKTSTYSLAKWGGIKTGTIKKLVLEFLEDHDEPMHIAEVMNYVNKFRQTNEKNVLSNLKLDKSNTFLFYKGGYIGLTTKTYPELSGEKAGLKLL